MSKKDKSTFASMAKQLIAKYKRASFDPTEKAELEQKLSELAEEQELYREANGMNNEPQMQQEQPMQQFATGSDLNLDKSKYPGIYSNNRNIITDYSDPLALSGTMGLKLTNPVAQQPISNNYGISLNSSISPNQAAAQVPPVNQTVNQHELTPYSTSIVPSLVAGGISSLGNLFLANKAKNNYSPIELPRATANKISLDRERRSAKREAGTSSANLRRNIKSSAKTRGELMGNISASEAAMQKNLADIYGRSYQNEEALNAQEAARVQQMNMQMAANEAQYNSQMQNRALSDQQAYQSAAIGAIPQTMRDIRESQQNDALINSLGDDYGIFQQDYEGRKWYQPKKTVRSYRNKK